jgi:hypothetical protein
MKYARYLIFVMIVFSLVGCTRNSDRQLSEPKYMSEQTIPQLSVRCNLRISWRDGNLHYVFTVNSDGTSDKFLKAMEKPYSLPVFTFNLYDKHAFNLLSVTAKETTRIVNDRGEPNNLVENSHVACSKEMYRDIVGWDVGWRGEIK